MQRGGVLENGRRHKKHVQTRNIGKHSYNNIRIMYFVSINLYAYCKILKLSTALQFKETVGKIAQDLLTDDKLLQRI